MPGATPGKWASVWYERLPDVYLELVQVEAAAVEQALEAGEADAAIGRLPVDKDVFSAIPLYEETSVVCFSRDHLLAALADDETVSSADIAGDPVWVPADDVLFATHPVPGTVPADPGRPPAGPGPDHGRRRRDRRSERGGRRAAHVARAAAPSQGRDLPPARRRADGAGGSGLAHRPHH